MLLQTAVYHSFLCSLSLQDFYIQLGIPESSPRYRCVLRSRMRAG